MSAWDVVVVGAGAAGLAAASVLAEGGARAILLDDRPEPGDPAGAARLAASGAAYHPESAVWQVTPTAEIWFTRGGHSEPLMTALLVIATGAMVRPGGEDRVPEPQMARSIGCDHRWSAARRCFLPVADAWGETSISFALIAGGAAGLCGVASSDSGGRAGLEALRRLGRITQGARDSRAGPQPTGPDVSPPPYAAPEDDSIICPCEGVSAGAVRAVVAQGCLGPNQAKTFLRVGMGPCQGRLCGLAVSELIADARGVPVDAVGYFRIRPPLRPVTVGGLAAIAP